MSNLEDTIEQFDEQHPVLAAILIRLAICVCWGIVVCMGLFTVVAAVAPLALILNGSGLGYFLWWLIIPILATFVWIGGTSAVWLQDNFL